MKELYTLGKDSNIIIGITNYPENIFYYDNDPVQTMGRGICLIFMTEDAGTYRVIMDEEQAQALLKGLSIQREILIHPNKKFSLFKKIFKR